MIGLDQVADLVDDDVIDQVLGCVDQLEIEGDFPVGGATAPLGLHPPDDQLELAQIEALETGQPCFQALLEDTSGVAAVPVLEQLTVVVTVLGPEGVNHNPATIHFDDFIFLSGDHLEAVLPAKVAMGFAADVLTGRKLEVIALEGALLFDDPGGPFADLGFDQLEVGIQGSVYGDSGVGVDVDRQGFTVLVGEGIVDPGCAVLN